MAFSIRLEAVGTVPNLRAEELPPIRNSAVLVADVSGPCRS